MWKNSVEVGKFIALTAVLPVGLLAYMCFTLPKFKKGDCIRFDFGHEKVYIITSKRLFRYVLDGRSIVSIEITDRNAKKVSCG
jgi:hypothetical protein